MNDSWAREAAKAVFRPERYLWWHALLFYGAASGVSGLATGRGAGDRKDYRSFYEGMEQAPFDPPGWAFGPAWALNNASTLWGNLRLLNAKDAPDRRALLVLQGASWVLFFAFGYVYFRKRSPILALADTAAMWALTVASVAVSLKGGRKDVALSVGTLLAWLTLATPVASYQAVKNPDPLLGYEPRR